MTRDFMLLRWALWAAALVPVAYFGAQIVAAPFYPNYSLFTVSASDLGSPNSSQPWILNAGAMLTGALSIIGAWALGVALPKHGVHRVVAWLVAACAVSTGLASIWAGTFPLPDPRHNPGAIGAGMFVMPFVCALAAWQFKGLRVLRVLLILNVVAFFVLAAFLSGAVSDMTGVDVRGFGGLLQKLIAVVSFVPSGLLAMAALCVSNRGSINEK
jgi:hypothetical membrane protein